MPDDSKRGYTDIGIEGCVSEGEIARGGFAVVYRGYQPAFGREVAVKLINVDLGDATYRKRFEREIRSLGQLSSHPHIVPTYEAGFTSAGRPFIIMELQTRGSLVDRVSQQGPLRVEEATAVGVKIAGALATAHHSGILHRDVKPENILVSAYREPRLADFGIAQVHDMSRTQTGTVTASILHVAPEVLSGQKPSVEADVYSLASTLFYLLAGKPAFLTGTEDDTLPALIMRVVTGSVPDLRPGVPDAVCRVIEKGMSKDPAMRQATAVAFGQELQEAQGACGLSITELRADLHGPDATPVTRPLPHMPSPELRVPDRPQASIPIQPQSQGQRPAPPQDSPPPPHGAAARVILNPAEVIVDPGEEATTLVRVRNLTPLVAEFTLCVVGTVKLYADVQPAVLHLFPNEEGSATVRFTPPRSHEVRPGPLPFAVRVSMTGESPETVVEEGRVLVGLFPALEADLVPRQSRGRLAGKHHLRIANNGNAPVRVAVRATDADEALRFRIRPATVQLAPGVKATAKVTARPRRARFLDGLRPQGFSLEVGQSDGPPLKLNGMFTQRPIFSPWMAVAAVLLIAATVVVAVLASRQPSYNALPTKPVSSPEATQTPATTPSTSPGVTPSPVSTPSTTAPGTTPTPSGPTPTPARSTPTPSPIRGGGEGGCVPVCQTPTPIPTPTWAAAASLPTPRNSLAVVAGSDGTIYAIGGIRQVDGNVSGAVEAYKPGSGWVTLPSLITPRYAFSAAPGGDGRIYVIGGENASNTTLASVEVYTPGANAWTSAPSMHHARYHLGAAMGADGNIYAVGGYDPSDPQGSGTRVEMYAPSAGAWVDKPLLPTPRNELAVAAGSDGTIYAIGGIRTVDGNVSNAVEAYSPSRGTWTTGPSLSSARFALTATAGADGGVYAIGGRDTSGATVATVEVYSRGAVTWAPSQSMPSPRYHLGSALASDGRIYAVGGYNPNNVQASGGRVESY